MARKYNFIFSELMKQDTFNLLGLIAYSMYKNDQISFIQKWREEHPEDIDGQNEEELDRFHKDSIRRINHYKELAENRLET